MKPLIPLLIVILSFTMYYMYIDPLAMDVKQLMNQKDQYASIITKTEEIKSKQEDLIQQYNNIPGQDIEKLNKIVPQTFNEVAFANDLNAMAVRDSIIVKEISVTEPASGNQNIDVINTVVPTSMPYKTNIVSITVTGDYPQFIKFLQDMELSLNLIDISKISIKTNTGSNSNNKQTANTTEYLLELKTYSLQ